MIKLVQGYKLKDILEYPVSMQKAVFSDMNDKQYVIEQTENVVEMDCIQALKGTPDYPEIHGWVFDMRTGKIVELDTQSSITNQTDKGSLSLIRKLKSLFKKR